MTRYSVLILLLLAGCASPLPIITEEQSRHLTTRWPQVTSVNLNEGRTLYLSNCSSCHSLYRPSQFNDEQWERIMNDMQMRAHLTDDERELILKYLIAANLK